MIKPPYIKKQNLYHRERKTGFFVYWHESKWGSVVEYRYTRSDTEKARQHTAKQWLLNKENRMHIPFCTRTRPKINTTKTTGLLNTFKITIPALKTLPLDSSKIQLRWGILQKTLQLHGLSLWIYSDDCLVNYSSTVHIFVLSCRNICFKTQL